MLALWPLHYQKGGTCSGGEVDRINAMGNEGRGALRLLYPQVSMVMTK